MKAFWHCVDINNFGDVLPEYIMRKLFGIQLEWSNTDEEELFMYSGSCMQDVKSNVICGCLGFGSSDQIIKEEPKKILSVRGKITQDMVQRQGIFCPSIYFDFVNYLPNLYAPLRSPYKRIYVPHYVDSETRIEGFDYVDICSGINNVMIELMGACSVITSSLHIMMVCELFKIPYKFAYPTNEIAGDGMKYHDYFSTLGKPFKPIRL